MHDVRVWSEHVPYERLMAPETLELLGSAGATLLLAVRPHQVGALPDALAACARRGVRVGVWPMLADDAGRWPGAHNAEAFASYVRALLAGPALGASEIVFDLEPPFPVVSGLFSGGERGAPGASGRWWRRDVYERSCGVFAGLSREARAAGMRVSCALVPAVLFDGGGRAWQRALGTPAHAVDWDHVNVMVYPSILEGWSRGLLSRGDAVALLARAAATAAARYGARASVSLGAVGVGALGDEPVYRHEDELAEDAAVALAAGVSSLALFDLTGMLARGPAERWLRRLTDARPGGSLPSLTGRARAALALGRGAALAAGLWLR